MYPLCRLDERKFTRDESLRRRRLFSGFDQVQLRFTGLVGDESNCRNDCVDIVSLKLACHRSDVIVVNLDMCCLRILLIGWCLHED